MPGGTEAAHSEMEELVALMEAGRFAALEEKAEVVLRTRPKDAAVWQLLGLAIAKQGKDALQVLATAVQCSPDDAVAHVNLGNELGRRGRLEEAAARYACALALEPRFAEAHDNVGVVLSELGRPDEAVVSHRRAIEIRPDFAGAHQHLGGALAALGHHAEAVASFRRALEIRPDNADAHNGLGHALLRLARVDAAMTSFRDALAVDPGFVEAHVNLANALRGIGLLEEAESGYRRALAIQPDFVPAWTELGTALRLQRRSAEAEAACGRALDIDPNSAATLAVLAELRADTGRFGEAEVLFKRAASIDPESAESWAGITRVRRMTAADDAWLAAAQRLAERGLAPQREMLLRFALGKYFDDVKEYPQAFRSYQRANDLARRSGPVHDRAQLTRTVDLIVRSHGAPWLGKQRGGAIRSSRPVFIVGMLRSGTTLAEQILASHPAVFGAGELTFWSAELAAALAATGTVPSTDDFAVTTLQDLASDERLVHLAGAYLAMLRQASATTIRAVDKFPTNFFSLGLIHAAFPEARIIHMRRNPIDTCLSIYFQHFEAANTYANDLADLAHYYGEYSRIMRHWRAALPAGALLEVPYEDLVKRPEDWTRRMLQFIDLPWNRRCLDFHQTSRAVVTASKWQVRQKINSLSVERWRHYEGFVEPLMALLQSDSD